MDRDGGAGPKTELDLAAAAAAAVEVARGHTELDVAAAAAAALELARSNAGDKHTELDVSAAAAAAVEASRGLEKATEHDLGAAAAAAVELARGTRSPPRNIVGEHATVIGAPSETGTPLPKKPRISVFAPTAALSDLSADSQAPAQLDELEELPEGTLLAGRYHIKDLVGQGGMGAVYAAHDDDLDEDIALKILRPDLASDADFQRRLKAEVRLARRVSHPNVCRVHDLGVSDDLVFVTMELVRGHTLRERLAEMHAGRTDPLSLAQITDIVVQLGAALSAAHRAGVIHRDVKPDNVILAGSRAVLTDFGVASLTVDRARSIVGTPAYLAPEVLRGETFDHRVDVYAVATLAYELITGAPPFGARTIDVALQLAREPPPYPPLPVAFGTLNVRTALDRVLARGLAADPLLRSATIDRLTDAFAHATRGAPQSHGLRARTVDRPTTAEVTTPMPLVKRTELRVTTSFAWFANRSIRDTEAAERIVVDAGGSPIRIGPGEILALFGATRSLGDDADRAAHAALDVVATFGGRVGLDTTRITLRSTDNELAGPDSAASATMLVEDAPDGEVWASPITARQLAARFAIAPTAGAARRITRMPAMPSEHAVAHVRSSEVDAICAHLERACAERTPVFVEVRGAAGSGKTRVRKAMIAQLSRVRDVEWLVATATPGSEPAPLSLLQSCSREWYDAAIGGGTVTEAAQRASAARSWLETRATHRPLVIVVEDSQWLDASSRRLLARLQRTLSNLPIAVVMFVRGDAAEPPRGFASVTLAPLDHTRATELARSIAPDARTEDLAAIVMRAAGNPFFIEELARDVASGTRDATLPTSIEAVVQAHLDQLPELATQVARCAAVVGQAFWRPAVMHVAPSLGDAALDSALADLERAGVIAPAAPSAIADDCYRFTSTLVRDVAYSRLPARDRRQMHAAIAGWLDERPHLNEQAATRLNAIAHHRERAGDTARAALAYRQAGTHCLELFAYGEAVVALRKAAALTSVPDPVLDEALADAIAHTDGSAAAEPIYQRALDETDDEDVAARARLWCKLGSAAGRRGMTTNAIARFNAGLAIVAPNGRLASWAAGDPRTAAGLWSALGWTLGFQLGRVEDGLPYCERAVQLLETTPYRRELADALSRLGGTYMRACRFSDQLRCLQQSLEIAVELGDSQMQLSASTNLGVVHGVLGDLDRAVAVTLDAREMAARMDARSNRGIVACNLAGFYLELRRLDEADRLLDETIEIGETSTNRSYLCEAFVYRARVAAARDDLAAARLHAEKSLALARSLGNDLDAAIALRIVAALDSRAGDHEAARARIEEALVLAITHDDLEGIRTRATRARILARAGDPNAPDEMDDLRYDLARLGLRHELAVLEQLTEVR
jgi:tetratricopeptide (TPR) repeat protein